MVEDELNTKLGNNGVCFSLMHLNARSLLGNFDKFNVMLSNLKKSFSVIGVTETWLNDHTFDQVNIPGYKFVSNHRSTKSGDLYIKKHKHLFLLVNRISYSFALLTRYICSGRH